MLLHFATGFHLKRFKCEVDLIWIWGQDVFCCMCYGYNTQFFTSLFTTSTSTCIFLTTRTDSGSGYHTWFSHLRSSSTSQTHCCCLVEITLILILLQHITILPMPWFFLQLVTSAQIIDFTLLHLCCNERWQKHVDSQLSPVAYLFSFLKRYITLPFNSLYIKCGETSIQLSVI